MENKYLILVKLLDLKLKVLIYILNKYKEKIIINIIKIIIINKII